MKKYFFQYWKVIIWCILIFVLSSFPMLPKVGFIWWDYLIKKSAHIAEYAILYYLVYDAMDQKKNYLTPLLFCITYALTDELHQSFVMGRTSKFTDVGYDIVGMLFMLFILKR
jgi:hypothetical protein